MEVSIMKERNKVANVFTSIAPEWNSKGKLIARYIGQKNPFKNEYKNWLRNGMRILDVGCGAGKNILRIDAEYEDCELYGIDISSAMIEIAEQNSVNSKNHTSFINVDFLEFDSEMKYDVIIFNYVLHHMEKPQLAIEKAYSLLKNNGLIMITVPGTEYLRETFPYCQDIVVDSIGRFSREKVENMFTPFRVVQLLYKKSVFLMKFDSYEQYMQYLKSIGTYQKLVNYSLKKWSMEFERLVMNSFMNAKYITGHYDMYVYFKKE